MHKGAYIYRRQRPNEARLSACFRRLCGGWLVIGRNVRRFHLPCPRPAFMPDQLLVIVITIQLECASALTLINLTSPFGMATIRSLSFNVRNAFVDKIMIDVQGIATASATGEKRVQDETSRCPLGAARSKGRAGIKIDL